MDLSSGRFVVTEIEGDDALGAELERLAPAEVLIAENSTLPSMPAHVAVRELAQWQFDEEAARRALNQQFQTRDLSGFGCEDLSLAISAAGCLLDYVKDTQRSELNHLVAIFHERQGESVVLDAATRRNLEIDTNIHGGDTNTLLSVYQSTITAMGTRHLRRWLNRPINQRTELESRLSATETLLSKYRYEALRRQLEAYRGPRANSVASRAALGAAERFITFAGCSGGTAHVDP